MKVSVYLGSSTTCLEEYNTLAYELGRRLCEAGCLKPSTVGILEFCDDIDAILASL